MRNFLGAGNYYPHLFCSDIANYHGNKRFGQIYKRNFYTSLVDLLQADRSNRPVNFMGIAEALIEALAEFDPRSITIAIGKLILATNNERHRIMNVINIARSREAAVRGEVRLDFEHLASFGTLLYDQYTHPSLIDKIVVISTDTIVDLITCYVTMLFDPIIFNLARINCDVGLQETKDFNNVVTTITVFESLLYFSLFSGTTHSYAGKLIWATGPSAHNESLRLMNSIKKFNHPVFDSSIWDAESLRINNNNNEIFEDMMLRLAGKRKLDLEAIKLMMAVKRNINSPIEIATMLWVSYFNEIPSSDFSGTELPRWQLNSLNTQLVKFISNPVTIREAALKLFNLTNLDSIAWKKPFLRAYKYWKSFGSVNDVFEWIITAATEILHIEVIRYHIGPSRFFATGHTFQRIRKTQDIPIANRQASAIVIDSLNEAVAAAERSPEIRARKGLGITFEKQENIDLVRGYNSFYKSNSTWMDIKTCVQLCFASPDSLRDNVSLKDRFRYLKVKNLIVADPMNSEKYLIPGFAEECRKPCEKAKPARLLENIEIHQEPIRQGRIIQVDINNGTVTAIPTFNRHTNTSTFNQEHFNPATIYSTGGTHARSPTHVNPVTTSRLVNNTNFAIDSDSNHIFSNITRTHDNNNLSDHFETFSNSFSDLSPAPTIPAVSNSINVHPSFNRISFNTGSNNFYHDLSFNENVNNNQVDDDINNTLQNLQTPSIFQPNEESRNSREAQNSTAVNIRDRDSIESLIAVISTTSDIASSTLNEGLGAPFVQQQTVPSIVREFMDAEKTDLMISKLHNIPTEIQDDYRFTDFSSTIPRLWKRNDDWKNCYNRLVEAGFIIVNERRRIRRNF